MLREAVPKVHDWLELRCEEERTQRRRASDPAVANAGWALTGGPGTEGAGGPGSFGITQDP